LFTVFYVFRHVCMDNASERQFTNTLSRHWAVALHNDFVCFFFMSLDKYLYLSNAPVRSASANGVIAMYENYNYVTCPFIR